MYQNYPLALIVTFATLDILWKLILLNLMCFISFTNIIDHNYVHKIMDIMSNGIQMKMWICTCICLTLTKFLA